MLRFDEAANFASRDVELRKRMFGPADGEITAALMSLVLILIERGE